MEVSYPMHSIDSDSSSLQAPLFWFCLGPLCKRPKVDFVSHYYWTNDEWFERGVRPIEMQREDIVKGLRKSIEFVHESHHELLDRNVREEALTFYFAGHLIQHLDLEDERDVDLDVEYNKHLDDVKNHGISPSILDEIRGQFSTFGIDDPDLEISDLEGGNGAEIRPDILLHDRGTDSNNLLIAEVKKEKSEITQRDAAKVLGLTHPDSEYSYSYGAVVPLAEKDLGSEGFYWVEEGQIEQIVVDLLDSEPTG